MSDSHDIVVAGAGHNSLIAAACSVSGAPGRNAAAVMLEDLGTSIEEVINF